MTYLINHDTYYWEDEDFYNVISSGNYQYIVDDDKALSRPHYGIEYCFLFIGEDYGQYVEFATWENFNKTHKNKDIIVEGIFNINKLVALPIKSV